MTPIGARLYGFGAVGLGIVMLAYRAFPQAWLPVSVHTPGYLFLVYAVAAVLIVAGLAMNGRRTAPVASLVLAAVFALGLVVVHLPNTLAKPGTFGAWYPIAESGANALGGVLAWALLTKAEAGRAEKVARLARWALGPCLLVFGAAHFVYAKYTAALVPAWLPPSQMVWTYVTGAAQIAAGLAMLSGVRARLAAVLLTVMYAVFTALVHIPSVIAHPMNAFDWAENAINLILIGMAWSLAETLSAKAR